jgi:hypothetical protein
LPSEQTINREEEAILWRSLEKIPELYREPLVLLYREHQSIEQVASALELSEDAVKQRLSRGRKLLQEEVQAFVEGALRRTAPGQAFSGAVLLALPLASPTAATSLGVGAKGTAAAKSGLAATWLLPFAGFLAGFLAQWIAIDQTAPKEKRAATKLRLVLVWMCLLGIPIAGEMSTRALAQHFAWTGRTVFAAVASFWCFWCICLATWFVILFRREQVQENAAPMNPVTNAVLIMGTHLTIFYWLILVAWRGHDELGAGITAGAMLLLGVWRFLHSRGMNGMAVTRSGYAHLTLCCATVIAITNLRLDVWCANVRGVTVAEAHALFPLWIVPLLTAVLTLWIAAMLFIIRPALQRQ